MSQELDDILLSWKNEHGERVRGKKYDNEIIRIPIRDRKDLFRHLVKTLIDELKWDKDSFQPSVIENILKSCFPPEDVSHDKVARKRGFASARGELALVINEFFGKKGSKAEIPSNKEYDPGKHKPIAPPLDRSVLADAPKPNTDKDSVMDKFLGFTDE
jgi:hypothetical protein